MGSVPDRAGQGAYANYLGEAGKVDFPSAWSRKGGNQVSREEREWQVKIVEEVAPQPGELVIRFDMDKKYARAIKVAEAISYLEKK